MSHTGHPPFEAWADLALGGMPLETARSMESHRRACSECEAVAIEAEALAFAARKAETVQPRDSIWPDLAPRLADRRAGWLGWTQRRPVWVLVASTAVAVLGAINLTLRPTAPTGMPNPVAVAEGLELTDWPGVWLLRAESEMAAALEEFSSEPETAIGTAEDPDYDALTTDELARIKQYLANWQSASL